MDRLVVWIITLLLISPNLYLYSKNFVLQSLLLSLLTIVYLGAVVKSSRYLVMLYPVVLLVPFILFYIHYYESNISEQVLGIIFETNWQEALGFLGNRVYYYTAIFIIWIILITILYWYIYRHPVYWSHRSRWWIIISISLSIFTGVTANQILANEVDNSFENISNNFLVEEKNGLVQELKQTYPLGLFVSFYDLYREQSKINEAFIKHQKFKFQASSLYDPQHEQTIILVIGETSRRANWQLNDYKRKTNPLLSSQKNIINFRDMIGVSNATRSSIPMLLTRKPTEKVHDYDFSEKSIISAFKEAGFATYWLSNQQKFGNYDTSTSVYAKEADHIKFLNKTNYSAQGETDEVVLPEFKKILSQPDGKKFIIIHTLGSHFDYSHRYPLTFDVFKPSLNNLDIYNLQDSKYKEQLINSYDNSILYTDYILNEVIETIKTQKQTDSFLLYSSDHGEDLFDGSCDKSGHGNETAYNFEIASFVWFSESFATQNPKKIQYLKSNQDKKLDQTSIFPTLIDAANINIPHYQLDRSILNKWSYYPRFVMGSKDYDRSSQQGSCREIK